LLHSFFKNQFYVPGASAAIELPLRRMPKFSFGIEIKASRHLYVFNSIRPHLPSSSPKAEEAVLHLLFKLFVIPNQQ
jgi:hypothetical protein